MITPNDRVNENEEYKKNFYVESKSLFSNENPQETNEPASKINTCREERDAINIDLIHALTQANIPLEKVDRLKPFFLKYCKNSGSIVESTQLHSRYLPIAFNLEIENLKLLLVGKRISITIDESPDVCGRAAVNVLFSFYNTTKLVKTEHLDIVNNTTITQLVMKTLQFYNIPFENIIFFISDNASYMVKAFSVLSPLITQMKHNRCLAHILNLVGETWVGHKNFKLLDDIVMQIKASFTHNNARKRNLFNVLEFFKIHNKPVAPSVSNQLTQLEAQLQSGTVNPPLNDKILTIFNTLHIDSSRYIVGFREAYQSALNKFKKHIDQHQTLPLFKAIQCFDPYYFHSQQSRQNINLYKYIPEFENPNSAIIHVGLILNEKKSTLTSLLLWAGNDQSAGDARRKMHSININKLQLDAGLTKGTERWNSVVMREK
ncbi:6918_t:CDS:2, partial [Scutellospora calospora]